VISDDVNGVKAYTVAEDFITTIATGFSVTPSAANGILLLHLLDTSGKPKAGVAGSNLVLSNATGGTGPKVLDANRDASNAAASAATGWVVFFEVPPGVVALGQAANATVGLQMASSPVRGGLVTIANVTVTDGAPPPPTTNVSFSQTIFPIFTARGC